MTPPLNQDGRQAKNRKKGDEILKIFSSETTEPIQAKLYWNGPLVVPFLKLCPTTPTSNQYGRQAKNRKRGACEFQKSSPLKLLFKF